LFFKTIIIIFQCKITKVMGFIRREFLRLWDIHRIRYSEGKTLGIHYVFFINLLITKL